MLEVTELDKELPSLMREVDFVALIEADGERFVLVVEFQTAWENDMPQRALGYSWRAYERYGLPVYPVVVVFRKSGALRDRLDLQALELEVLKFRFRVVPVWELDGAEIVAQKWVGLYPLLPLMKWEGKSDEVVLRESQDLVLEQIVEREPRADAYVALRVLSGIRHPVSLIDHILRRKEIMVESPVYQEILKEGRVMGLQEGKVLGLQEGKVLGLQEGQVRGLALGQETRLREDILEALEVRFGMVPYEVEEQVRRLRGQKTLEGLLRKAILVESLEAFGEMLSSVH
ncbi:MAG: hypothetical protein B1H02_06050 [Candidatus Latescibacteria bacterium 4484_107]|nr:MAG: hypothetical protein B1H02_06050 [Candidatus Latescibacteria bacterium 4484_107]